MPQFTPNRQALSDIRWERAQSRETSYIVAQEAARQAARVFALSVEAVSARYTFAPAHDLFRYTADGVLTQVAMTLTEGNVSLTVVRKVDGEGEAAWFITDASRLHFSAQVYLAAVQARLERNRAENSRRAS